MAQHEPAFVLVKSFNEMDFPTVQVEINCIKITDNKQHHPKLKKQNLPLFQNDAGNPI